MTYVLITIGVAVGLSFLFQIHLSNKRNRYESQLPTVVLRVAVSKTNERGPIVAEQIFSAIHGIGENYGLLDYFGGKTMPRISLEIANVGNKIQFFIWAPRKFKNVIESQIYAQYPDVEIEEVEDYTKQAFKAYRNMAEKVDGNVADPENPDNLPALYKGTMARDQRYAVTAELELSDPNIYPIKRFSKFEDKLTRLATEPLAGICATLSKLNATDEQAWVQITMEPVGDWWRKRGLKCLKVVSKGLFSNVFWLSKMATNIILARGFWKRFFLSPIAFIFWFMRRGGINLDGTVSMPTDSDLREETSRSHDREDPISAAVDKVTRITFGCNIRIVYLPRRENIDLAELKLNEIAGSFKQFNQPNMNGFQIARLNAANAQILKRYQQRSVIDPSMLNVEEVATLYHMPSVGVSIPNMFWVTSRKLEPPHNLPIVGTVPDDELNVMGESNFRGHREKFGIKTVDRRRHIYIIGKTGMGKSVLLENLIFSDVQTNKGLAVIDPHGDLADAVVNFIPSHRTNDVVILDPSDVSHPFAFNMLEYTEDSNKRNLMASGLLGVFKKMYADSWGPRLEHILRNCLLGLVEYPNTSMLGIMRILVDKEYRKKVVSSISNPMVRSFWVDEFNVMQDKQRTEAISPIQNKVGQFLSSPMIRNIVGQVKSTVNIRFMMDTGKIIVVNLSKGKIGEDNSSLLGSMLITKFQLDAMSRADMEEKDRRDFYLYVDEFQNFATDAFATILSEARKYRLSLVMANQYVAQMPEEVRDAVFGNVGTSLCFQVGFDDAEYFSNQFSEEVLPNDIITLPKYNCYTKLMIDGMPSPTFSIATLPPPNFEVDEERRAKIIRLARERYCRPREVVEDKIARWAETKKLGEGKQSEAGEGGAKQQEKKDSNKLEPGSKTAPHPTQNPTPTPPSNPPQKEVAPLNPKPPAQNSGERREGGGAPNKKRRRRK